LQAGVIVRQARTPDMFINDYLMAAMKELGDGFARAMCRCRIC
jgi:hypothetical protein